MDEPDYEKTNLSRELDSDSQQHLPLPGLWLARRRRALAAVSILAAVVLLLSVWLPLHAQDSSTLGSASLTPLPTFTSVPLGPTATPILLPTPVPVAGLLSTPPRDCPAAPPLDTLRLPALGGFSGPVQMTGGAPVWAVEGYFPQRLVDLSPAASAPYWPSTGIMWEIDPHLNPTVTVRAFRLDTGEAAWWALGADTPQVPALVMNPARDFPANPTNYWDPYFTRLFITHAGCYDLQVSWVGEGGKTSGHWYTIFAAGQTGTAPPA